MIPTVNWTGDERYSGTIHPLWEGLAKLSEEQLLPAPASFGALCMSSHEIEATQ